MNATFSLTECDRVSPENFQAYLSKMPYPWTEKVKDIVHPILMSLKRVLAGPIERPFDFRVLWHAYYPPKSNLVNIRVEEGLQEKDLQKIDRVCGLISKFAAQMGLGKVYIQSGSKSAKGAFSASFSPRGSCVTLSTQEILASSDEGILFPLLHELAHVEHRDPERQIIGNAVLMTLEVVCLVSLAFFLSIWVAIPVILLLDRIGDVVLNKMSQRAENQADDRALQILGKGAKEPMLWVCDRLKNHLRLRYLPIDQIVSQHPELTPEKLDKQRQVAFSPLGNNRYDLTHPSLTDRLKKFTQWACGQKGTK